MQYGRKKNNYVSVSSRTKDRTKMSGINHRYSLYNAALKENNCLLHKHLN